MELKKKNEYSESEKKELLFHWWHYYNENIYGLKALRTLTNMIYCDIDTMYEIGLYSYIKGDNGQKLINAIKKGCEKRYCELIVQKITDNKYQQEKQEKEEEFIELLVAFYEKNEEQIITANENSEPETLTTNEESDRKILTQDKVTDLYKACVCSKENITEGEVADIGFVNVLGLNITYFDKEKINDNKQDIVNLISEIKNIDIGSSWINLFYDKKGTLWTSEMEHVERLIKLGLCSQAMTVIPEDSCYSSKYIRNKLEYQNQPLAEKPVELSKKKNETSN